MPQRGLVIALEGPSGAGKSTLSAYAARTFGWALLAEAVDRLEPSPSLEFGSEAGLLRLERRLLEEDARRFRDAKFLSGRGSTVLLDTGPLGTLSYTAGLVLGGYCRYSTLDRLIGQASELAARSRLGFPDIVLYLATPPAVRAARRRADPLHHPAALRVRHERVGRFELATFRPWLDRRLPSRVRQLRGNSSPSVLAGRLERAAATVSPLRDPCGRLSAVLRDLPSAPFLRRP